VEGVTPYVQLDLHVQLDLRASSKDRNGQNAIGIDSCVTPAFRFGTSVVGASVVLLRRVVLLSAVRVFCRSA
jgi:hypothetical protein